MGTTRRSALLLALLVPLAAGPRAAATDAEPAAAVPVPPAPGDAAAVEAYAEVRAAFARAEYGRALEAARPVLRGEARHESVAWVLYMVCVAEGGLDHHLSCVEFADRYLHEMRERGHAERGYTPPVVLARARSLAALGREGEAAKALGEYLRAWPGLTAARDAESLLVALRVPGPWGVDAGFGGRLRGDSWFRAGTRTFAHALPAALERVRERLGAPEFPLPRVAVYFRDAAGDGADRPASTSIHCVSSRTVAVIRVSARALVERRPDFVELIAAEVFRACVLASGAEGGPAWLLGGLEAWVSSREPVDPVPALHGLGRAASEPASHLDAGLEGVEALGRAEPRVQRAAGLLLVAEFERAGGPAAVRRLARRVLDGADPTEALGEALGRPPRVVLESVAARARAILQAAAPESDAAAPIAK